MEPVRHYRFWLISGNAQLCQSHMNLILVIRTMINIFMQKTLRIPFIEVYVSGNQTTAKSVETCWQSCNSMILNPFAPSNPLCES